MGYQDRYDRVKWWLFLCTSSGRWYMVGTDFPTQQAAAIEGQNQMDSLHYDVVKWAAMERTSSEARELVREWNQNSG